MVARNEITGKKIEVGVPSQALANRMEEMMSAPEWSAPQEEKVFVVAYCNRCHVKIMTHNAKCPGCNEPVEV